MRRLKLECSQVVALLRTDPDGSLRFRRSSVSMSISCTVVPSRSPAVILFPGVRRAGIIRNLTKEDLTAFFERYISPASDRRAKLAVLFRSQRFQPDALRDLVADVGRLEPDRRDDVQALAEQKPTLSQIEAFVAGLGHTAREQLASQLSALRTSPPLPTGSKEIESDQVAVDAFRRALPLAEPYRPKLGSSSPTEQPRL